MCGHVFLYQDIYHLQRHRPVWQCGTCGRVSHVPLDCCTRPEVARQHPAVLAQRLGQWVSGFGRWTLTRLRPLWHRQPHPTNRASYTRGIERPEDVVTEGVSVPTTASDERPEVEDMAVAAGERMM
jgi:hypothetical protein